jgi:hypothetical protein
VLAAQWSFRAAMSYDLQVWSANQPALPACLPEAANWRRAGGAWSYEKRAWQVNLNPADRVLPEDVPEAVSAALPGVAWLTELNLEPLGAAEPAHKFLARTALRIAKAAHGVVLDPQQDTVRTPQGVKRWISPGADDKAALINLSWWWVEGPPAGGTGFGELLDVLAATLPEALPRRYGLYEPPQHIYAETGRAHFLSFLAEHARGIGIVWYPHAPVAHVNLEIPEEIGGTPKGFRSGKLEIELDAEALRQPGWPLALSQAWRRIGRVVRPFYGDVRTLRGYQRNRGRYWLGRGTEQHPVCSWWWAGVPQGPAHAAVVGEPYLSLWPAFSKAAECEDGLAFITTSDWLSGNDAFQRSGPPPTGIGQLVAEFHGPNIMRSYPPIWPFEAPRESR